MHNQQLNHTKTHSRYQVKSKKTLIKSLEVVEKEIVGTYLQSSSLLHINQFIGIVSKAFINGGQFIVSQREIGNSCGITREWANKTLNNNPLINVRNRGHRALCAYSPVVHYGLHEIQSNAVNSNIFRQILNNIVGKLYYSKTFIEITNILKINPSDTLSRFSDNAYGYAHKKMQDIMHLIENKEAYFYSLCFNYHKKYNIPLLT